MVVCVCVCVCVVLSYRVYNVMIIIVTSPPQSHLGRARSYPLRQRLDSPISCAANCAIPTADKSNYSATGKELPLPWLEIITPKFPIGTMEKMKIAYNSAYIQIEMFNCTLFQQGIIVYCYLCANFQEISMRNA